MAYTNENQRARRRRRRRSSRRGATAVEMAILMVVFLTLVLGMLDMGLAVFRYHVLAQAARFGSRQAIVHGSMADRLGPWGPQAFSGSGVDSHPVAKAVRPSLTGINPAEATVEADWIDGGNDLEDRIRVSVSVPYRPIMTFIFGNPSFTLRGTSTMPIAH